MIRGSLMGTREKDRRRLESESLVFPPPEL